MSNKYATSWLKISRGMRRLSYSRSLTKEIGRKNASLTITLKIPKKEKKKKLADFTLPLNSSCETIVHWLNNLSKLTIYSLTIQQLHQDRVTNHAKCFLGVKCCQKEWILFQIGVSGGGGFLPTLQDALI